jgi:NTP pyrophosphatase (non-canonical NTP hydrolase)
MARKIEFDVDSNNCFVCTSHKANKDGYRQIVINNKLYIMHRFIYEQCAGEIPAGMVIRHKCDNTHCINPEHLELGTNRDNTNDMISRGRANPVKGEGHGKSKLTHTEVYEIYKRSTDGENMQDIANDFNVDKSTIFKIKKGETWKHLRMMFKVLHDVEKERIRQVEKWKIQRHNPGKWLAILMEEVGEVAQAAQKPLGLTTTKETDADDLYLELMHVSAVAAAWMEQIREERENKK